MYMGDAPLKYSGIPRVNHLESHLTGELQWQCPKDIIVDGTATPGTTADNGTDGVQQFGSVDLDQTTDEVFVLAIKMLPPDFDPSYMTLDVVYTTTVTSGTFQLSGTARIKAADGSVVLDVAGTAFAFALATVPGTASRSKTISLNIKGLALVQGAKSGWTLQIMLFRDVSEDNAAADVKVTNVRLRYARK